MISACCTACGGESRLEGQNLFQLWKEGPSGRELSRTQEVQPLWQEGPCSKRLLGEARQKEEEEETSFEMLKVKKKTSSR